MKIEINKVFKDAILKKKREVKKKQTTMKDKTVRIISAFALGFTSLLGTEFMLSLITGLPFGNPYFIPLYFIGGLLLTNKVMKIYNGE